MRDTRILLLACFLVHLWEMSGVMCASDEDVTAVVKALTEKLMTEQVQDDVPFTPLLRWEKKKGLFHCDLKLKFAGDPSQTFLRQTFGVFDNNPFVTGLTVWAMLETYRLGGPRLPDPELHLALKRLLDIQNRVPNLDTVVLERLRRTKHQVHTPPDFDDTFINLAVGTKVYQLREEFPQAWQIWSGLNTNLKSVFDALKKYAYQPFSEDPNVNSIDPKSYYVFRGFFDRAKTNADDLALPTTWVQNTEELRQQFNLSIITPSNINSIDAGVCANIVYTISAAVLTGLEQPSLLGDPLLQQIYHDSAALVAYTIENNFAGRPELAMPYYTSRFQFLWFASKTVDLLSSADLPSELPILERVLQILEEALKGDATKMILYQAQHDGLKGMYFDDFLGNGDVAWDGKTTMLHAEDRIFTTAMAMNTLLYTWTTYNSSLKSVQWKADTPDLVKMTVEASVNWIVGNALSGRYAFHNSFFTVPVKNLETVNWRYPANKFEYLNGTVITDWSAFPKATDVILAVQGYIDPTQYDAMLDEDHFGFKTPKLFKGFNCPSPYIYWSSDPYTYASVILALTRYSRIGS